MINKVDSIKLSVTEPKVRFIVVVPDVEDVTPDPLPHEVRAASREVRSAINAWLYSQEA